MTAAIEERPDDSRGTAAGAPQKPAEILAPQADETDSVRSTGQTSRIHGEIRDFGLRRAARFARMLSKVEQMENTGEHGIEAVGLT